MDPVTSDAVTELPPEIITVILHLLPAKSLGRFRCVSKHWLTQITNPQFIKTHQSTLNRHHMLCNHHNTSLYSLTFNPHHLNNINNKNKPMDPHVGMLIFHGSCNGLVLACKDDAIDTHSLVVGNPTTSEFVNIPEPGCEALSNMLDIDIVYGFGYDAASDDYKVVTVSYYHYSYLIPPNDMSVHVYSVRNNTWTQPVDSPFDHSDGNVQNMHVPGVFVSGCLHWIACKGEFRVPVIAAFSLADEVFRELPLPGSVGVESMRGCKVVVVGEKLGMFLKDEVWLMNEYGVRESWLKIRIRGFDEIPMTVDPTIIYEDGKIVLVSDDGRIRMYDVEKECFCESVDISRNVKGFKVKGVYVESLVSPKFR
ncbi:F-box/kelch-repeat protein At3g06240-like [Bidens hawaiensis]|uniref:F-box/kelch-repeat protein At3g06240-like n=1 Tax=Bidens hawaiensis TaxID=980011 RepID=UPI00404AAB84